MLKSKYYKACVGLLTVASLLMNTFSTRAAEVTTENRNFEKIEISTAEELAEFAKKAVSDEFSEDKYLSLTADIDLSGREFSSISIFAGEFDGNGHTISGFENLKASSESGFINNLTDSGKIKNLTIEGKIAVEGNAENIGGIVGVNNGIIENCTFRGSLVAEKAAGGIAGLNEEDGSIVNSKNEALIAAKKRSGGIVGDNEGTIESCVNSGSVNTIPQDDEHLSEYKNISDEDDGSETFTIPVDLSLSLLNGMFSASTKKNKSNMCVVC